MKWYTKTTDGLSVFLSASPIHSIDLLNPTSENRANTQLKSPMLRNMGFLIMSCLTETASFTFGFEESEDISKTDGTFNVADDRSVRVNEFNAYLSDTTTRTSTSQDFGNSSELAFLLGFLFDFTSLFSSGSFFFGHFFLCSCEF